MTTIDALKNLYVELGGNLEDVENINVIPKMIDALSEIAGSTIELPGVTSEDNGDVLTVVNGKWAKAEVQGSLPAVTSEDNGDVLTVVEGAWAKGEAPKELPTVTSDNNGEVLTVVNGSWTNGNSDGAKIYEVTQSSGRLTLPSEVVSSDIYAELEAGKNIKFKDQNGFIYSVYIGKTSGYHIYSQTYKNYSDSKILCVMFAVENNSHTYFNLSITELAKAQ